MRKSGKGGGGRVPHKQEEEGRSGGPEEEEGRSGGTHKQVGRKRRVRRRKKAGVGVPWRKRRRRRVLGSL